MREIESICAKMNFSSALEAIGLGSMPYIFKAISMPIMQIAA